MLKILILVCAAGLERGACTETSADSVTLGPRHLSVLECGLYGQAQIAKAHDLVDPARQYVKLLCQPEQLAAAGR